MDHGGRIDPVLRSRAERVEQSFAEQLARAFLHKPDPRLALSHARIQSWELSGAFPDTVLVINFSLERRVPPLDLQGQFRWPLWDDEWEHDFERAVMDVDHGLAMVNFDQELNGIGSDYWNSAGAERDPSGRFIFK